MSDMPEKAPRSRASLWLIIALCVAPVVASYVTFYFFAPSGRTNYGELVETKPLPVERLNLADGSAFKLDQLRGKWLLMMTDDGACASNCPQQLLALRQLRLTQGRDMSRIERVWLVTDNTLPAPELTAPYAGTWLVRAAGSELLKALSTDGTLRGYIHIVDPLGNLVLRYRSDADPGRIIKDLTRLLKTSGIG